MLRIAIIEDDKVCMNKLADYIKQFSSDEKIELSIETFNDAPSFLFSFQQQYDIIFTDIDMPKINGYDASKMIREKDENVVLVFVTQLTQYAIKGYEVNASDYILKPVEYDSLKLKMKRFVKLVSKKNEDMITISTSTDEKVAIKLNSLIYIESDDHLLKYVTNDNEYYSFGSLKKCDSKFPSLFFRCHASYLINLSYVERLEKYTIFLKNGFNIPLSRSKKKEFMEAIQNLYINGE